VLAIRYAVRVFQQEQNAAGEGQDQATILAIIAEQYLRHGLEAWTLVDERAKPLAVTWTAINAQLLSHPPIAEPIVDAADALYAERYVLPLLAPARPSSPSTLTNGSTSPTNGPLPEPRTPSRRSSISTTPTAVTAPITT
jgi:hypothetical protein